MNKNPFFFISDKEKIMEKQSLQVRVEFVFFRK